MQWFALIFLFGPAVVCAVLTVVANLGVTRRRRRAAQFSCRRHIRIQVSTSVGYVTLCQDCDAGTLVDGRWEFAPAVQADHTL